MEEQEKMEEIYQIDHVHLELIDIENKRELSKPMRKILNFTRPFREKHGAPLEHAVYIMLLPIYKICEKIMLICRILKEKHDGND